VEHHEIIREEFNKYVNNTFKNEGIKNFLLNHERLPLLISNLSTEIRKCDMMILSMNKDLLYKRNLVRGLAKDFSKTFCNIALETKRKELVNG
jgi:hypothetical protein